MNILASSTGYAILAAVGSIFVIVLGYIASILFRSGEFAASIRRMAFLDDKDVKLELCCANKTGKSKTYTHIGLAIKTQQGYQAVAYLNHAPFLKGQDGLQVGPSLVLKVNKGAKATFVLDFYLNQIETVDYYLFCQSGNKTYVAAIDLTSYKQKPIYFHSVSAKTAASLTK